MSTTSINIWQNKTNPSQALVGMELGICEYIMSEDGELVASISWLTQLNDYNKM